jgi:predicted metal-binding protein
MKLFEYEVIPVIDHKVRTYCTLPYPGHPKGCPMFGKRPECPPQAPLFEKFFNMKYGFTAVVCELDLAAHAAKMLEKHPHWTIKQCRNPLYWQNSIRKALREYCWVLENGINIPKTWNPVQHTLIPEAMGLDVVATMKSVGVNIVFPVTDTVRKVAIIGTMNMRGK